MKRAQPERGEGPPGFAAEVRPGAGGEGPEEAEPQGREGDALGLTQAFLLRQGTGDNGPSVCMTKGWPLR